MFLGGAFTKAKIPKNEKSFEVGYGEVMLICIFCTLPNFHRPSLREGYRVSKNKLTEISNGLSLMMVLLMEQRIGKAVAEKAFSYTLLLPGELWKACFYQPRRCFCSGYFVTVDSLANTKSSRGYELLGSFQKAKQLPG